MALLDLSSYFPVLYIALGSVIVLFSRTLVQSWRFSLKNPPYPPGPPTRGLLEGNLKDIPTSQPWLTYTQWGKEYGELVHFRIYGQHTIVLNSFEAVKSLLEQRSNIYSDRPHIEMIYLTGWVYSVAFKRYGAEWRAHRRLLQQSFRPEASLAYRPIIARKVHDMLYNLVLTPEDFQNHYRTVAAAIIMGIVYGYDIEPKEDYFVSLAEAAVSKLSVCFFPGANAVNAIPILRYLPEWFPGAAFHHFAKEAKDLNNQMIDVPFEFVKKTMAAGTAPPSVASDLLSKFPSEDAEKNIKQVCATAYAGGADTTSSLMGTFFSLMALHPEIQKKAQREIDHVVGSGRLVDFDDRESLPYLDALCREIVRWRPVLPLCVTHGTSDEDTYKGYYIPKGANVIPNVWAMSRDPEKFQNPDAFNPDRYFDEQGNLNLKDQENYVFGFGRRICPGRHMADSSVWLAVTSILSVFDIGHKKDSAGNVIPINIEYTDGLISHPLPFECSITPRSSQASQIIFQAVSKRS